MSGMLENAGISSGTLMKGALGILAPLILSRVLRGGGSVGRRGGMMSGMGGGLGGMLGGLLGGMGGGGMGGYGRTGGGMMGGGGLGSLVSILGGLGGRGGYSQRGGTGGARQLRFGEVFPVGYGPPLQQLVEHLGQEDGKVLDQE